MESVRSFESTSDILDHEYYSFVSKETQSQIFLFSLRTPILYSNINRYVCERSTMRTYQLGGRCVESFV